MPTGQGKRKATSGDFRSVAFLVGDYSVAGESSAGGAGRKGGGVGSAGALEVRISSVRDVHGRGPKICSTSAVKMTSRVMRTSASCP